MTKLLIHRLPPDTAPAEPEFSYPSVSMDDPALAVMTDLTQHRAITGRGNDSLHAAERLMISAGVRLLLVVDGNGAIVGLLSYRDIIGERATTAAAREGVTHDELTISAVMTPAAEVETLDYDAVTHAHVRDLVRLMHERGRQHALVTESVAKNRVRVRGIFSITQIGRQLGIRIEASGVVQSFAELERLIAGG
ncbi:MAG: CBS domain-containing protein [Gammaproteobacteria bacterium]